jgi:hypothetical protein
MKKILLLSASFIVLIQNFAQKQIQDLPPARLGIFKNGTCFIKREALVDVTEKTFYIKAPDKVLMGTYWVFVGKESSVHSIVVKTDTFKVTHAAKSLDDYLEANTGEIITLYGNAQNADLRKLTGKLLEFDAASLMMKVAGANGKIIIASANNFDWFESSGNPKNKINVDSMVAIAKIYINNPVLNGVCNGFLLIYLPLLMIKKPRSN